MTDHQFETHQPVALYVEIGSGQIDVTATDTTESRVEITGRHADEVDVTLTGRDLRIIAPRRRTGFFGGGDESLFVTVTVPTGSDLAARTGSTDETLDQFGVRNGEGWGHRQLLIPVYGLD